MTGALLSIVRPLGALNGGLLAVGRGVGAFAMAAMVVAILVQVVFRYGFNNALPWPDEAARFCMLWMTGMMAPTAFRRGGFVAIDMLGHALPRRAGAVLGLVLLCVSLLVLVVAVKIGWGEVTGFGGRFKTAALYLPLDTGFETWFRVPRSWMMMSLFVGVVLLTLVNIELILRALVSLLGAGERLPVIPESETVGAE